MTVECPECGQLSPNAMCLCGYRFSRTELKAATESPLPLHADTLQSLNAETARFLRKRYKKQNLRRKPVKTGDDYLAEIHTILGKKHAIAKVQDTDHQS